MDVVSDPSGPGLMIADAKYYHLDYREGHAGIHGNAPGVDDVLKQWAYKEIIARDLEIERKEISNILLFPYHGRGPGENLIWPFATVENQLMDDSDRVVSCFVDAERLLRRYIRGNPIGISELDDIHNSVLDVVVRY